MKQDLLILLSNLCHRLAEWADRLAFPDMPQDTIDRMKVAQWQLEREQMQALLREERKKKSVAVHPVVKCTSGCKYCY